MLGLPLAFAAPAVLAALALLAALYLFLRVTPPRPRQVVFPPLRLLLGLDDKDATPAKTPWPLLALRHRRSPRWSFSRWRGRSGTRLSRDWRPGPLLRDRRRRLGGGADLGRSASPSRATR